MPQICDDQEPKIQVTKPGLYETYNANCNTNDVHFFVSHNGLEGHNRVSFMGRGYSATAYLSNAEALALAKMLTDSVNSHRSEE